MKNSITHHASRQLCFLLLTACAFSAHARITKIVIDEVKPFAAAESGGVATEQIAGRAFGEIDPTSRVNRIINDIQFINDKGSICRNVCHHQTCGFQTKQWLVMARSTE